MSVASFVKINPKDTVVVCLRPFNVGEQIDVDGKQINILQDIPAGHKILIDDTPRGVTSSSMVTLSDTPPQT